MYEYIPKTFVEKGKFIYSTDDEENQLYEWIRNNTAKESIFIDSSNLLPVFAQRQLFIGIDKINEKKVSTTGYCSITWLLEDIYGYNIDLLQSRRTLVEDIYGTGPIASLQPLDELSKFNENIYLIVRTEDMDIC